MYHGQLQEEEIVVNKNNVSTTVHRTLDARFAENEYNTARSVIHNRT